MPPAYALYSLLALNLMTFLVFGWDKHCAKRQKRRVPEMRLYALTAFGGCIGAWLATRAFRHKTQKTSFRVRLAFATVISFGLWFAIYELLWKSD